MVKDITEVSGSITKNLVGWVTWTVDFVRMNRNHDLSSVGNPRTRLISIPFGDILADN
jgi:hypothetical protein